MTNRTATCRANIAAETLAAWRDQALSANEQTTLAAHIRTCAACQGRLARFANLAQTLQNQRVPHPDARLWRGVQVRIQSPAAHPARRSARVVWGSVGMLATLLVIVVLFAQVLGHVAHGTTSLRPTVTAMLPTTTATPPILSDAQAWGHYAVTHVNLSSTHFIPEDVFPDASTLVGLVSQNNVAEKVALFDIRTQKIRVLYIAPDANTPLQIQTEGRFVAWTGSNMGEGVLNGHQVFGYADTRTGRVTILQETYTSIINTTLFMDHGQLIWAQPQTGNLPPPFEQTDLASGITTALPSVLNGANIIGFSWPNLAFIQFSGKDGAVKYAVHILNVVTKREQDVSALNLNFLHFGEAMPISVFQGTSIFRLQTNGTEANGFTSYSIAQLQTVANIDQPGTHVQTLGHQFATTAIRNDVINNRLVAWSNQTGGNTPQGGSVLIWDRVQAHMVEISTADAINGDLLFARGHTLVIAQNTLNGITSYDVIDTSLLPTTPPTGT